MGYHSSRVATAEDLGNPSHKNYFPQPSWSRWGHSSAKSWNKQVTGSSIFTNTLYKWPRRSCTYFQTFELFTFDTFFIPINPLVLHTWQNCSKFYLWKFQDHHVLKLVVPRYIQTSTRIQPLQSLGNYRVWTFWARFAINSRSRQCLSIIHLQPLQDTEGQNILRTALEGCNI